MEYIQLGSTSLKVTGIGLGFAALGRPGYISLNHKEDIGEDHSPQMMQQNAHRVLDAAWDAGIRYFDTARSYGRAEEFVGTWLQEKHIAPDSVTIGSKWGYIYTANWQIEADKHEIKEHSLPILKQQWQETQQNLGNFLSLYQIHSATLESGVLSNTEVLNELARLKSQGTAIGLSLSGKNQPTVLSKALSIMVDGIQLFDTVQITWNLLEQSASKILNEAKQAGIGVIVKEAVANGRLTTRNQEAKFASKRHILEQQATRLGTTIDALAIAAVLAQPWADVVLSGAATIEQLHSNIQAIHVAWDEEAEKTLARIVEPPEVYWNKRSNLEWN